MARIIFDPVAKPHLLQHLEIVLRPHFQPLGLEQLALRFQFHDPVIELVSDRGEGAIQFVRRRHELFRRIKRDHAQPFVGMAGQRIEPRDRVDLVAEKLQPDRFLVGGRRIHLDHVAAHPEFSAGKIHVVALVEHVDEPAQHRFASDLLSFLHRQQHPQIIFRRRHAVDTRDARDHDRVAPREKRARCRQPEALDLFVNRRVLLDVSVRARNVGLGLVVIEIADEILDCVPREELLELRVELSRQRLIMRDDQRRPIQLANDVRHCEGLARTGHTEQRLVTIACFDRLQQFRDRLRLVAARFVIGFQLERHRAR